MIIQRIILFIFEVYIRASHPRINENLKTQKEAY